MFAISQLAQTTLRSEIGKIDLDRTFEERTNINTQVVQRARQGVRALGRQGAALRDQEHHAADGHARGDGEADARRAREARRDPHLRGRARRRHQQRRGREAAGHQGIRGAQAAADQRGRGPGARRSSRWRRPPPKASARSPTRSAGRAASRRCSCAWPSSTSRSSASWRAARTTLVLPANALRRRLDDRAGDERLQERAAGGAAAQPGGTGAADLPLAPRPPPRPPGT